MRALIQKMFNQTVNRTAFSLALQSVRLPLRYAACYQEPEQETRE